MSVYKHKSKIKMYYLVTIVMRVKLLDFFLFKLLYFNLFSPILEEYEFLKNSKD